MKHPFLLPSKKSVLASLVALGTLASPQIFAQEAVPSAVEASVAAENLALEESSQMATQLFVFNTLLNNKVGDLVLIDEDIQRKYALFRGAFLGSIPTSVAGGLAYVLAHEAIDNFDFIVKPIARAVKILSDASSTASERSWDAFEVFAKATGLDWSSNQILKGVEFSFETFVQPVIRSLVRLKFQYALLSGGASSMSGLAGTSSFLLVNTDANEAMTIEKVRNIMGQDEIVASRLDDFVKNLDKIYPLNESDKASVKEAMLSEIIKQAVEKEFSEDSNQYSIDSIQILVDANVIDAEMAALINRIQDLGAALAGQTTANSSELLKNNVSAILALQSILSSVVDSGQLDSDPATKQKALQLIGQTTVGLQRIGMTLSLGN